MEHYVRDTNHNHNFIFIKFYFKFKNGKRVQLVLKNKLLKIKLFKQMKYKFVMIKKYGIPKTK